MKKKNLNWMLALLAALALVFAGACSDGSDDTSGDTYNVTVVEGDGNSSSDGSSGSSSDNSAAYAGKTFWWYSTTDEHDGSATTGTPVLAASIAFGSDNTATFTAYTYLHGNASSSFALGTTSAAAGSTEDSTVLDACTFNTTEGGGGDGECYVLSGSVEGTYFTITGDEGESVNIRFPVAGDVPSFIATFTRLDAGGSLEYDSMDTSVTTGFAYPLTLDTVVASASGYSSGSNSSSLETTGISKDESGNVTSTVSVDDLFDSTGGYIVDNTFSVVASGE